MATKTLVIKFEVDEGDWEAALAEEFGAEAAAKSPEQMVDLVAAGLLEEDNPPPFPVVVTIEFDGAVRVKAFPGAKAHPS